MVQRYELIISLLLTPGNHLLARLHSSPTAHFPILNTLQRASYSRPRQATYCLCRFSLPLPRSTLVVHVTRSIHGGCATEQSC